MDAHRQLARQLDEELLAEAAQGEHAAARQSLHVDFCIAFSPPDGPPGKRRSLFAQDEDGGTFRHQ
jgi:hypothetical protein